MSFQRKKNIRLIGILLILVSIVVVLTLMESTTGKTDVDRNIFSINDATNIDKVIFNRPDQETFSLRFTGSNWSINNSDYKADPQRLKVLFAILKQVRVRRPVSQQLSDSISNAIKSHGVKATFYSDDEVVKEIVALGNESRGVTYMKFANDEKIYIVEIPGYRSYLFGIFNIDRLGWRDPLVYDINWRNMQSVDVVYKENNETGFTIIFENGTYGIKGLQKTDTTRLYDYLDDVSQLYVDDYLSEEEVGEYLNKDSSASTSIIITDVGNNYSSLELIKELSDKNQYLVRVDSVDFALLSSRQVVPILREKDHFKQRKN